MKCDLNLTEESEFVPGEVWPAVPRIKVPLYHENLNKSISTRVTIDTGFDESLILSRKLRDAIFKFVAPQGHDSLDAGDKWFDTVAHAPIIGDYENLIGRRLTNRFNICLRAPSGKVHMAGKR